MYIAFASKEYPERKAYEMLRQIRTEFTEKEAANAGSATENSLSKSCKKWLQAACAKYDNLNSVDKVSEIRAKVDDVKMTMENNVIDMLNQHGKLEDLEDKAEDMRSASSTAARPKIVASAPRAVAAWVVRGILWEQPICAGVALDADCAAGRRRRGSRRTPPSSLRASGGRSVPPAAVGVGRTAERGRGVTGTA